MIHTVYIDDSTVKGKKLLQNLHKECDVVSFEEPIQENPPMDYLSSSEFRKSVKQGLLLKLKSNGRL